jgi:hypothetical protein
MHNYTFFLHEFSWILSQHLAFLSYFRSGVFLIQNKICRGVPPISFSLLAPGPLVSALSPPSVPRAALGQHSRVRAHAIKRRPAAISAVRSRQRRFKRHAPLLSKPSPASPLCLSTAKPLSVQNRVPPPLSPLLSAAAPVLL